MSDSASTVAKYLLWLSAHEQPEDPDYLTNLKLQKLLYFVQGWHLAELGHSAFPDHLEAWTSGPVAPDVYHEYKRYGNRPITDIPQEKPILDNDLQLIADAVWDRYKIYSAFYLSDLTHSQLPWRKARKNLPKDASSTKALSNSDFVVEFNDQVASSKRRLAAYAKNIRKAARGLANGTAPERYTSRPELG